ncbi:MAG: tyrosine-type recombinase/integrase [Acidobacteriota bacterium]
MALARAGFAGLPAAIAGAGERTQLRFIEFFTANIRNRNTRRAYARAVSDFFAWCGERGISNLSGIGPSIVAAWLEDLQTTHSKPTVKQRLAAVRMLFDWLVVGNVVTGNPASSVRGPRHVVKRGRTPVLTVEEARNLLDSIDTGSVVAPRDKALISLLVYSFARIGAALTMKVEDYYPQGKRWWFRLHEKGGKRHDVPAHHKAEAAVDAYIEAAGIRDDKKGPLFRTVAKGPGRPLTHTPMRQSDAWRMIRRRVRAAGIDTECCCHTFRATGITAYLQGGGTLEHAQQIAAHESPRTTKLYDRTTDQITLDEIERIGI